MPPRVPVRNRPGVPTAPLPGVRVPMGAPQGAFGESLDLSGPIRVLAERQDRERQKADSLILLDADNHLATLQTDVRTKAMQRRGKDAFDVSTSAREEWEKGISAIEQGLASEDQRLRFRAAVGDRWGSLYDSLERHASSEMDAFETETTRAALANRVNDAAADYADLSKVAESVADAKAIVAGMAARRGLSDEARSAAAQEVLTKLHAGVIDAMLTAHDDRGARAYYASAKAEIEGTARDEIEQALETGRVMGEGQRRADAILLSKPSISRTEAFAEARTIEDDPELRQEVEQRLDIEFRRRDQAESDANAANFGRAFEFAERGQKAPAPIWSKLTPPQKASIYSFLQARATRTAIETDWSVYYGLKDAAVDPERKADFMALNLLQHRHQLSDTEFKELVKEQTDLREKGSSASLDSYRTVKEIVDGGLRLYGVRPDADANASQREQAELVRRAVDDRLRAWKQSNPGKEPPSDVVQATVDEVLIRGSGRQSLLESAIRSEPGDITKIRQVPASEQQRIRRDLEARGLPAGEADIIEVYRRYLARLRGGIR